MSGSLSLPPGVTANSGLGQSIDGAKEELDQMQEAFDVAIEVNAAITIKKTALGAEETAAQQRPNIG